MVQFANLTLDDQTPKKAVIPPAVAAQIAALQGLQKQAADTQTPIYSPTLGWAKVLAGGLGGLAEGMASRKEAAAQAEHLRNLAAANGDPVPAAAPSSSTPNLISMLFGGGSPQATPSPSPVPDQTLDPTGSQAPTVAPVATPTPALQSSDPSSDAPTLDQTRAQNAIAKIESGGDYGAVGPETSGGDRAYGKYQVMGANIPEWSKAATGTAATPDQFLADPKLQDAVFNHRFGQYVQKYGPDGAARAWFAGEGGMNNPNAKDRLGTTVTGYADQFNKAYGQPGQQIASADPNFTPQPAQAVPPQTAAAQPAQVAQNADQMRKRLQTIILDPRSTDKERAWALQQLSPEAALEQQGKRLANDKAAAELQNAPTQAAALKADLALKQRQLEGEGAVALSAEERKKYGIPDDLPAYKTRAGDIKFGPAGSKTTVNTAPGPAKSVYDTMEARTDKARAAAVSLPAFDNAMKAIDAGGIFGAGADMRLGLAKVGSLMGLDPSAVQNTETFRAAIAPTVLATVKGLGSGTGISNADREFAEKAAGGNINLDPGSIRRLMDIGRRAAQATIAEHNRTLDAVYPDSDENKQVRALFRVDPDAFQPPPAASNAPQPAQTAPQQPAARPAPTSVANGTQRTLNGKTYIFQNGNWYQQ